MSVTSEQLWEAFSLPLHQFIQRRVPDPHSADDLLQDVFLRVHTRIDTLHQADRVGAWLYQITRNAIADYYRAQRPAVDVPETLPAAANEPGDTAVQTLLPCVRAMVEQLPPFSRDALYLTEYAGLTQQALGEQLGISFSGAKSRVQRARAQLKAQLLACCHFEFELGWSDHRLRTAWCRLHEDLHRAVLLSAARDQSASFSRSSRLYQCR